MPKGVYPRRPLKERFWEKVAFLCAGPDECWEWRGAKDPDGYGEIKASGKTLKAHRVSWTLENGPIPEGMCVLHTCDNPGCVNPFHLWTGAHLDNMQDKADKGRQSHIRGEAHGNSRLTERNVHRVRDLLKEGWSQQRIADLFGITDKSIGNIKTGKCWGWLKEA